MPKRGTTAARGYGKSGRFLRCAQARMTAVAVISRVVGRFEIRWCRGWSVTWWWPGSECLTRLQLRPRAREPRRASGKLLPPCRSAPAPPGTASEGGW